MAKIPEINNPGTLYKKIVTTCIALLVGLLHFVTGPNYQGPFKVFVNSYLIDILLPFALYLLGSNIQHHLMGKRIVRASVVFLIGACVETLQYFKVPIFGKTFDPLDFLMYGIGVLLGVLFDVTIISRLERMDKAKVPG